jgi:hypothetical protein
MCENISQLINCLRGTLNKENYDNEEMLKLYRYLIDIYWKEDVDLVMMDEFQFEYNGGIQSCMDCRERRNGQSKFRKRIIEKYKKCLITGIGPMACEACHIKSFMGSTDLEKYDIDNGLLLCANLHKLFDKYLISINPSTCRMEISIKLDIEDYKELEKYKNKKIKINEKTIEYLHYHYSIFLQMMK